eukprot:9447627-Pyramimonas_sp.AAC.1
MKDGQITKEDLRKTSKGKGKGKDKSDKTKNTPAPDKPKDQYMKYLGYDYDAEEGYTFMLDENGTEELDHISDSKKEPNHKFNENDESYLIPIEFENDNDGKIEVMVDSCAARSVCPPGFAPRIPREEAGAPPLRQAD